MFEGINLGNFGGQLKTDELNGALSNAGSSFQFAGPSAGAGAAAPAQPAAPTQATDNEVPGAPRGDMAPAGGGTSEAPLKGIINIKNIATLVGSYFGGPLGGKIGSAVGGIAGKTADQNRAQGVIG